MKPQTNRQRQAHETKQRLFADALRLFAEKPYEDVTVSEICAQSNASVGAFYHHFKNKESILNEGYRLFDEALEEKWNQGHPEDNREAIGFLVDSQMESMEGMGPLAAAQYFKNQLTTSEKYVLSPDRFFYTAIQSAVQKETESGGLSGSVHAIVEDILSISRGIIYDWCLHGGAYNLAEKGRRGLDMVMRYYERAPAP